MTFKSSKKYVKGNRLVLNAHENISKRIAQYRTLAGYTQESAAAALGVNKNSYARMERTGTPKPEMLKKLSALFNIPAETILYGEKNGLSAEHDGSNPVLKDTSLEFKSKGSLLLTTNEKNVIRLCRSLTPQQRSEVLDLIAGYIKKTKEENK